MVSRQPVDAAILFPPKEYKLYERWQQAQPSISIDCWGLLPTAFEYEEFLLWRKHESDQYLNNNKRGRGRSAGRSSVTGSPEKDEGDSTVDHDGPGSAECADALEKRQKRKRKREGMVPALEEDTKEQRECQNLNGDRKDDAEEEEKDETDGCESGADSVRVENEGEDSRANCDEEQKEISDSEATESENDDDDDDDQNAQTHKYATKCSHPLHPAHPAYALEPGEIPRPVLRCPLCTMRAHLNFLSVVISRWSELGGPWRLETLADIHSEIHETTNYQTGVRAYHRAKLSMIRDAYEFEQWAEAENEWEAEHVDGVEEEVRQHSAHAALDLLKREYTYPSAILDDDDEVVLGVADMLPRIQDLGSLKTKHVIFTPDTADTRARPNLYFFRACTDWYDADTCPNACPGPEGWAETSFMKDYMYTVTQCRILLLVKDDSLGYVSYVDLNDGPDRSENKYIDKLQDMIRQCMAKATEEERTRWIANLMGTSDIFFVWHNEWKDGEDFNSFATKQTLVDTIVEQYARVIGDIDVEEYPEQVYKGDPTGGSEYQIPTDEYLVPVDEEQMALDQMDGDPMEGVEMETAFCDSSSDSDSDSESSSAHTPSSPPREELIPKDPEIVDQEVDDVDEPEKAKNLSVETNGVAQDQVTDHQVTSEPEEALDSSVGDTIAEPGNDISVEKQFVDSLSREVETTDTSDVVES